MSTTTLLPGAVLGIVGGGQLGRMTAMAAHRLGYRVHALSPDPKSPIRGLCDRFIQGDLNDPCAAQLLASDADAITCEREDVAPAALQVLGASGKLRPGAHALGIVQDRLKQKRWLQARGIPLGPFRAATDLGTLQQALSEFGGNARVKRCHGGFDGRGQWKATFDDAEHLWAEVAPASLLVERELELEAELSVLVARSTSRETAIYPVAHNFHRNSVLHHSVLPAALPVGVMERAQDIAETIADAMDVVGLLAVEFFYTTQGMLLVNELAPRPHNTFHSTEWASTTCQFEQLVRAVCGLPLGSTATVRPTAIANLLGDDPLMRGAQSLNKVLALSECHLRLYGKESRPGRKLGHVAVTAETSGAALRRITTLLDAVNTPSPSPLAEAVSAL